jgi:hypothetical protein
VNKRADKEFKPFGTIFESAIFVEKRLRNMQRLKGEQGK